MLLTVKNCLCSQQSYYSMTTCTFNIDIENLFSEIIYRQAYDGNTIGCCENPSIRVLQCSKNILEKFFSLNSEPAHPMMVCAKMWNVTKVFWNS